MNKITLQELILLLEEYPIHHQFSEKLRNNQILEILNLMGQTLTENTKK